tara:strand:- start:594 stop:704 length:111 start_codon:yes stop_codon:yes gene_type:complete
MMQNIKLASIIRGKSKNPMPIKESIKAPAQIMAIVI